MAMHDHHENLPGYNPDHILHDGCLECVQRSEGLHFEQLDGRNFERMWERSRAWNYAEIEASDAEVPMLKVLWRIMLQLEHRGVPIGTPPGRSYAEQVAGL